jgi:hypothetical protein
MIETTEAPAKKKAGRPKGVKRSVKRLTQGELALAVLDSARGIPQHQIAKKFGVGEAAISMILDKFKPAFAELQNVEEYRKAKASLLDSASLTVLKEIVNPVKIEAGDVRALATTYDILNKHSRLERGESTSNVSTQSIQVTVSGDDYAER